MMLDNIPKELNWQGCTVSTVGPQSFGLTGSAGGRDNKREVSKQ